MFTEGNLEKMRIAEYKQIDVKIKTKIIHHEAELDDDGNIIKEAYDEEINVEVPVMGMTYREATAEEIAEIEQQVKLEEQSNADASLNEFMTSLASTDTTSFAKLRAIAQKFLDSTSEVS
jgi:hypothetical protein